MNDVRAKSIFEAKGHSVAETFDLADKGLLIPVYQRPYLWEEKHIDQLFDGIMGGFEENNWTFIGSAIFSKEKIKTAHDDKIEPKGIVDGQQRIITLLLLIIAIDKKLLEEEHNLPQLGEKISKQRKILHDIFTIQIKRGSRRKAKECPVLIRELYDKWNVNDLYRYRSPIAKCIQEHMEHTSKDTKGPSPNNKSEVGDDKKIQKSREHLKKKLGEIKIEECYQKIRKHPSSLSEGGEDLKKILSEADSNPDIKETAVLVCLAQYILHKVVIVNVDVVDSKYTFDIFESLNTTGALLTAIDTLKPLVVNFYKKKENDYEGSADREHFDYIDKYLGDDDSNRQKNSTEITLRFLLLLGGEYTSRNLRDQQQTLRKFYQENSDSKKEEYIRNIRQMVEFYRHIWGKRQIKSIIPEDGDSNDEASFHLSFIRDSKTKMAIPIIFAYWYSLENKKNAKSFKDVCAVVASFIALWRGSHRDTSGIDDALRSIISGRDIEGKTFRGTKFGKDLTYAWNPPPTMELGGSLKSLLVTKGIDGKDGWIRMACRQPMYKINRPLCRYLLLISHNGTKFIPKDNRLKRFPKVDNHLKSIRCYNGEIYRTVEHIAPQEMELGSDWHTSFSEENKDIPHQIGNLTLLPVQENSMAGRKKWEEKKVLYEVFSSDELNTKTRAKLKKAGIDIGKNTEKILSQNKQIKMT